MSDTFIVLRTQLNSVSELNTAVVIQQFKLTDREVQVLILLASGLLHKEIQARLGITMSTISKHMEHIYEKLGIHSVVHLVHFAIKYKFIEVQSFERDGFKVSVRPAA